VNDAAPSDFWAAPRFDGEWNQPQPAEAVICFIDGHNARLTSARPV
jgi:hypothetical protein